MSKFVCVDNDKRFYLPVDSIISFGAIPPSLTVDEPTQSGIRVKYWEGEEMKQYDVLLDNWNLAEYCKSLQSHINLLK